MQEMRKDEERLTPQEMLLADALKTAIDTEKENEVLREEVARLKSWHHYTCYLVCLSGILAALIGVIVEAIYG